VSQKNAAQLGIWTAHSQRASLGVVGFDCSEAFGRSRFARQLTTNTFC
jgi:hypothetical protein